MECLAVLIAEKGTDYTDGTDLYGFLGIAFELKKKPQKRACDCFR